MALPLLVLFAYPIYRYETGACYGDMYSQGGYTFDPEYFHLYEYDPHLSTRVTVTDNYESVATDSSILILGDSFTQQGPFTFTEYLQAAMPQWKVFNVQTATNFDGWQYIHRSQMGGDADMLFLSMTDFVVYILQHAKVLPNTIVIESNECFLKERMLAARMTVSDDSLVVYREGMGYHKARPYKPFLFGAEAKPLVERMADDLGAAQTWIKKHLGISRGVYRMPMDGDYFTCRGDESQLYFCDFSLYEYNDVELNIIKSVMRQMVRMAEARGVNLIFFITPDKMQLYRKYCTDVSEKYDNPSLIDAMSDMAGDPHFQFNKTLLQHHIERGEKDLYYCNDIHWTYKAARITAKELAERILRKTNDQ